MNGAPEHVAELVANISEGRDRDVVAAAGEAAGAGGATLLDVHTDSDHNRSVLTLAGPPEELATAAVDLAGFCVEHISLAGHEGVHPRLGALDVCPFVALDDLDGLGAVKLAAAQTCAAIGSLGVPVFTYELLAVDHVTLPEVRRHAFVHRHPDHGPPAPHPTAGAVAVGVRYPLVAYNIDLDTDAIHTARRVAATVRERAGGPPGLRALGLALPDSGRLQVSMNLTRPDRSGVGTAWRAVEAAAKAHGVGVLGGELVGLVPAAALDDADDEILARSAIAPDRTLEHRLDAAGLRSSATGPIDLRRLAAVYDDGVSAPQ